MQEIISVGEDVEKRVPSYTVGRNVNWCRHCRKQYGYSSKYLELPYDPVIPLWDIYPKNSKTLIQKDICPLCSSQHYLQ